MHSFSKRMLVEKYGEEKVMSSEKPMLAIAHGAAILAASMDTSKWKEDDDQSVDVDEEIPDGPIVYTAKHNYLIQLTKNGRKEWKDSLMTKRHYLSMSIDSSAP